MLPNKTKRGQAALERLKVFVPPRHDKFALLGCLAHEVGWKYQAITATLEKKRKEKAKLHYSKKKTVTKQAEKHIENKITKYRCSQTIWSPHLSWYPLASKDT
eukprot:superscaffoldBa00004407_g18830